MTSKSIIAGLVLGLCALGAAPASADVTLCNHSGREIWATYGEKSKGDFDSDNHILGWYHLAPNECKIPIAGCVCNFAAWLTNNCYWDYVFYAKDAFGAQWTGGEWGPINTCTTFNAFFEVPQFWYQGGSCVSPRAWLPWGGNSYPGSSFCSFTFNFNA